MKIFFYFSSLLLLFSCKTTYHPFFQDTADYYKRTVANNGHSAIKKADEGVYHFKVCMKDTTFSEEKIRWFCDCAEPDAKVKEVISMVFVDDARVVYYKNFDLNSREIKLDKTHRNYFKIGIYTFERPPSDASNTELKVTLHYPSSKDSAEFPIHLYFDVTGDHLSLQKMDYVKRQTGISPDADAPGGAPVSTFYMNSINPPEAFSYNKMDFIFEQSPYVLKLNGTEIKSIQYKSTSNGWERVSTFKENTDLILEDLKKPSVIGSW